MKKLLALSIIVLGFALGSSICCAFISIKILLDGSITLYEPIRFLIWSEVVLSVLVVILLPVVILLVARSIMRRCYE